jgi:hypothetical protein
MRKNTTTLAGGDMVRAYDSPSQKLTMPSDAGKIYLVF